MGMGFIGYLWGLDGALYIAQFCDLPILVNNLDRYTNHFLQAQLKVPTKLLVKAKWIPTIDAEAGGWVHNQII